MANFFHDNDDLKFYVEKGIDWEPLVRATEMDYRVPVTEGLQLFTALQRMGVDSKLLYFPDEGHWVLKPQNSRLWYKTVNDWVDQWTAAK